jgi:agmatine/peptidylarginine deiminase
MCTLLLSGCTAGPRPADRTEGAAAAGEDFGLPAFETDLEKLRAGKADEYDDYREAHPELYGVTAPPVVPVRPMAEYEPAQMIMMRASGSIGTFHKGILKGAAGHVGTIVLFHTPGQGPGLEEQAVDLGVPADSLLLLDVEKTDSIWTRDYGPISHVTQDGHVGFVDFRYYKQRMYDDAIATKLGNHLGVNVFRPSMSFEGGNFMADPYGTCYFTEKVYSQNGGHTKVEIDTWALQYLGCKQMVIVKWPKGLGTGHIDMFSKLMNDDTVLLGYYDPALQAENAAILDDISEMLAAVVTEGGKSLTVIRLPLPWDETGVWYTYTNALILNDTVLVPVYSGFQDLEEEALQAYGKARPDLEIHTVLSDGIIPSGGSIHCVTMTVPEGTLEAYQDPAPLLCTYNELNKCEGLSICGGLPYEGVCIGGVLSYCGSDGYPHAQSCSGCCAFDPGGAGGKGWNACLEGPACEGCTQECAAGQSGCSATGTHSWTCGESDEDACLERQYTACEAGKACDPATSACSDAAQVDPCGGLAFEGTCVDPGLVTWCEGGVVEQDSCDAGECCGWNAGKKYYGCISVCEGCVAECDAGSAGCSQEATHQWECVEALDGCPVREYTSCFPAKCSKGKCPETCGDVPAGGRCVGPLLKWCADGLLKTEDCSDSGLVCGPDPDDETKAACRPACQDECEVPGGRQCAADRASVLACDLGPAGCLVLAAGQPCPEGTECFDGVCGEPVPVPEPEADTTGSEDAAAADTGSQEGGSSDCSCRAARAQGRPMAGVLLLLLVVGMVYGFNVAGRKP